MGNNNSSRQYTDAQLRRALVMAAELERIDLDIEIGTMYVNTYEVEDLRRILDHLPGQKDDYSISEMQQLHLLQGLAGDINETFKWLTILNHAVAFGVKREELIKLASQEPSKDDDWQACEFSDLREGDRARLEFADITHEAVVKTVRKNEIVIGGNSNFTLYRYKNPKIFRIPAPVVHPDPEVNEFILDEDGDVWRVNSLGTHYAKHGLNVHPEYFAGFWTPAKVIADE